MSTLQISVKSLKERVNFYNDLLKHSSTDYKKVFIKSAEVVSPDMLYKRCQEFIEIEDSARPVIELIETGTTDVTHLIQKARGGGL